MVTRVIDMLRMKPTKPQHQDMWNEIPKYEETKERMDIVQPQKDNKESLDVEPPEIFLCPITQDVMTNPVVAADGHTYERVAIVACFQKGQLDSPMTGVRLANLTLTENYSLKSAIHEFHQNRSKRQFEQERIIENQTKVVRLEKEVETLQKQRNMAIGGGILTVAITGCYFLASWLTSDKDTKDNVTRDKSAVKCKKAKKSG